MIELKFLFQKQKVGATVKEVEGVVKGKEDNAYDLVVQNSSSFRAPDQSLKRLVLVL